MAPYNTYVAYKRDTRHLVYWMIRASNSVIKSLPPEDDSSPSSPSVTLNTSGQTTVAGFLAMTELVAEHLRPIPTAILQLLQSVIAARSAHHAGYQQLAAANPDAQMEKSNASHKYFVDALMRAFSVLGGDAWTKDQEPDAELDDGKIEEIVFSNKFSALEVEADEGEDSSDGDESVPFTVPRGQRRNQRGSGKGKKGKKAKKTKTRKGQKPAQARHSDLDAVPLESYRIIEAEHGIMTDYLMAVCSIAHDWADLRNYLQSIWKDVAYQGLNSAVAGTLSNLAIEMVKQTELDIFVEFPGHESYETLLQTIGKGDIDKVQSCLVASVEVRSPDAESRTVREAIVDLKEHVLFYGYSDLVDFVEDFQKNRTGKPTKAMLAEIGNWNPEFDLQRATREQRLQWRRSYTINWLYDLVNVYSSVAIQQMRSRGKPYALEDVDWSAHGPWAQHRVIFGLNDFAAVITTLAMQKPGKDARKKILPHHVFQLQLIIDAFTISRGWSFNLLEGHVLEAPAGDFRPRRDVDRFLDRQEEHQCGCMISMRSIQRRLVADSGPMLSGDFSRTLLCYDILDKLRADFTDWLGESKYKDGLESVPPSRFSKSNPNGLWEYSPFLCGVGLVEGLDLSYRAAMTVWDAICEPTLLVHLHNMLVQKGHLAGPVGVYACLEELLAEDFFENGIIPKSNFHAALAARMRNAKSNPRKAHSRPSALPQQDLDLQTLLDLHANKNFRMKSNLLLYREAGWNVDRIPDSDIEPRTMFGWARISQTKRVIDLATGQQRFEDTELIRRARAKGVREEHIIRETERLTQKRKEMDEKRLARTRSSPYRGKEHHLSDAEFNKNRQRPVGPGLHPTGRQLLEYVKTDLHGDVCGDYPVSAVNYLTVTMLLSELFEDLEGELSRLRNPLYVRAYETTGRATTTAQKRLELVVSAMREEDDECMRVMAEQFLKHGYNLIAFIYWDRLVPLEEMRAKASTDRGAVDYLDCAVM
ncbi:hypothetical protein CkaCkLH20_05152 [Colletotrichum karsti]|uniref:DUF6604 domain-containing protein n=1 Tax=Colletotrichum karsti TaxID=1095194 RepID=A0A9P6I5U0_9PEZI|nr:uncharacterized protein CkaCkLH20_05152 [Colletotrichum karsti]KAF9877452.1 hypothetical protein CkaCkLH20_05152 [Colletotrichum karsti]